MPNKNFSISPFDITEEKLNSAVNAKPKPYSAMLLSVTGIKLYSHISLKFEEVFAFIIKEFSKNKIFSNLSYVCIDSEHIVIICDSVPKELLVNHLEKLEDQLNYFSQHKDSNKNNLYLSLRAGIVNANNDLDGRNLLNNLKINLSHCGAYKKVSIDSHTDCDNRKTTENAAILQKHLRNKTLVPALQPIVNRDGKVDNYEVLMRIRENREIISPWPYIVAAEQMNFIDQVDKAMLNVVITLLNRDPNLKLSFNISPLSILNDEWLNNLYATLEGNIESAKRLIIEITENIELKNWQYMKEFFDNLRSYGVKISLDDFGSGSTLIRELVELEFDYVKIDGDFIKNLEHSQRDRAFLKELVNFISKFDSAIVAEYVSSKEIANIIRTMPVDYMQGNYFGEAAVVSIL